MPLASTEVRLINFGLFVQEIPILHPQPPPPSPWKVIRISEGEGDLHSQTLKGKYEPKIKFPDGWSEELKLNNLSDDGKRGSMKKLF